jgi:putative SOS response-associated peptidase YedK
MCGRFSLTVNSAQLALAFPGLRNIPPVYTPRFNIAPSQPIAAITNHNSMNFELFFWGLVPSWSTDPNMTRRMINARAETISEKPTFRAAYKRRRCLILADGYYEWQKNAGAKTKTPHWIYMKDRKPFAIGGIWEEWESPDGSLLRTAAIITTNPSEKLKPIHNRMPVIIDKSDYRLWLSRTEQRPDKINPMLRSYPQDKMDFHAVSLAVNSPANDAPVCIQPV